MEFNTLIKILMKPTLTAAILQLPLPITSTMNHKCGLGRRKGMCGGEERKLNEYIP